jgi:hypothetical protein
MANYRVMAQFENRSGLPEDRIVNTWWFQCPAVGADAADRIATALIEFYNTPPATGVSVGSFMASYVSRAAGASRIQTYNMADPTPREPQSHIFQLDGTNTGDSFPAEVSAVLSFYSDRNLPRQRGRVFLGPLKTSAGGLITRDVVPQSGFLNTVAQAADRLRQAADDPTFLVWSVHSDVSGLYLPVTNGWVDDAFDIQRRRGTKTQARTMWGL